jgi:hypothetical protein
MDLAVSLRQRYPSSSPTRPGNEALQSARTLMLAYSSKGLQNGEQSLHLALCRARERLRGLFACPLGCVWIYETWCDG